MTIKSAQQSDKLAGLDLEHLVGTLNRRYVRCLDQDQLEQWPDFFLEHGRYIIHPRDNREGGLPGGHWMYYSSRGMIQDRVTSLRHINKFNRRYLRHIVGDTLITETHDDVIHASTSYFLATTSYEGNLSLFSVGEYLDKVVIVEGEPKFLEKLVVPDNFNSHGPVIFPI